MADKPADFIAAENAQDSDGAAWPAFGEQPAISRNGHNLPRRSEITPLLGCPFSCIQGLGGNRRFFVAAAALLAGHCLPQTGNTAAELRGERAPIRTERDRVNRLS